MVCSQPSNCLCSPSIAPRVLHHGSCMNVLPGPYRDTGLNRQQPRSCSHPTRLTLRCPPASLLQGRGPCGQVPGAMCWRILRRTGIGRIMGSYKLGLQCHTAACQLSKHPPSRTVMHNPHRVWPPCHDMCFHDLATWCICARVKADIRWLGDGHCTRGFRYNSQRIAGESPRCLLAHIRQQNWSSDRALPMRWGAV